MAVARRFIPNSNVVTTIRFDMKFGSISHVPLRMTCYHFGYVLTFLEYHHQAGLPNVDPSWRWWCMNVKLYAM